MNVLIISPDTKGTIASLSYNLYRAFKENTTGEIICLCLNGKLSDVPDDIEAVVIEPSKNRLCRYFKKVTVIKKIIQINQIDLSISTLLGCSFWNVLTHTSLDTKIGIFHTKPEQSKFHGRIKHIVYRLVYNIVLPNLDALVAVNKSAQYALNTRFDSKTYLIYNIHNFTQIKKLSEERIDIENQIFTKPTFLFIGHLTPIKGVNRLIKAFKRINESKEYNLCIIGEGYLLSELEGMVNEYGIQDAVHFIGYKKNPYKYIRHCRCLVLPSLDEGLPGVLIEALYLGKRVVATNSSIGVWEIMQIDNQYNAAISQNLSTQLGTIVPNFVSADKEELTINMLADAMLLEMKNSYSSETPVFNYKRFSSSEIFHQYIKLYQEFRNSSL